MNVSPKLSDIFFSSGWTLLTSAHPLSKLLALLHFPGVAINQEALGVAQAGHHGLLQQLQDDTLQQREWSAWGPAAPNTPKSRSPVREGLGQVNSRSLGPTFMRPALTPYPHPNVSSVGRSFSQYQVTVPRGEGFFRGLSFLLLSN